MPAKQIKNLDAASGSELSRTSYIAGQATGGAEARKFTVEQIEDLLSIANSHVSASAAIESSKLFGNVATIAALKALTGMADGQTANVRGYTTAGDGGAGEFYWDSASSASAGLDANSFEFVVPDAGGTGRWKSVNVRTAAASGFKDDIRFLPAGTGAVARTVQARLRDSVSAFDFMTNAQIADVQAGTALVDVTDALNAAFQHGITAKAAITLPAGRYKVSNTLWAAPEGSVFQTPVIIGAGAGYRSGTYKTLIDGTSITSKPVLNVARVRGAYLGGFQVLGGNKDILTDVGLGNMTYSAAYVSVGFRDSRYSPQCGIAIDAGVGSTPPDGGYSGFTYQGATGGSFQIYMDDVSVSRCVVGLMHNPESNTLQGDEVLLKNFRSENCKVNIASGQSQARVATVIGGGLGTCRTAFDGLEYGQQQGSSFAFISTQFGPCFEMFSNAPGFSPISLTRVRAESVHRIGQSGVGASTGAYPAIFTDVDIHLLNESNYPQKGCPIIYESTAALLWNGGHLDRDGVAPDFYNFFADPAILECVQLRMANRFRPYIGMQSDFATQTTLRNCRAIDGTSYVLVGNENRRFTLQSRVTEHWSANEVTDATARYSFAHGNGNTYINGATASAFVFSDTQLVFDLTTTNNILVGDILHWRLNAVGKSLNQNTLPALKIASIVGTTITCSLLFPRSYYDETFAPTSMRILVHEWAPGSSLTGDTASGSPTLSNVSPTGVLQVGDWIKGNGIPSQTRVTAVVGATVTMAKNATATATGISLFWGTLQNLSSLTGSATFNPGSLADGAGETTTVTVAGAALGDYADASFSLDLQGITVTAWVSATNTVSVRFQNETGGTIDLASGTLRARVRKA